MLVALHIGFTRFLLFLETLKSEEVMANWISLDKAASKYGVETEDVRFWAEVEEIASVRSGSTFIVDDESIQEFLTQCQTLPTRDYIQTQKLLLENQIMLCEIGSELVKIQGQEMERMKKEISLLKKINALREEQSKRILEITQGASD